MNTVKTLVYRLIKKGFVKCEKNDYPCKYRSNLGKCLIIFKNAIFLYFSNFLFINLII